jgi:hypothetical protein
MSSAVDTSTVPFAPEKLPRMMRAHAEDVRGEAVVALASSLKNAVSCL